MGETQRDEPNDDMAASISHALTIAHLSFCTQLQSELKEASEKLAQAPPPTVIVAAPLDPLAAQSELSDRLSAEVGRLKAEVERLTFEGMTKQPALKQLGIEIELERVKRQDMAQVGDGERMQGNGWKGDHRFTGTQVGDEKCVGGRSLEPLYSPPEGLWSQHT